MTLWIIGDGPERDSLRRLAQERGVSERVRFVGAVDQSALPRYYSAADALVLASSREGWANVLLESLACGTPVAATAVGGTPEVIADAAAGVLITRRSVDGVAAGLSTLLASRRDRAETRDYASRFDWSETSAGQYRIMQALAAR